MSFNQKEQEIIKFGVQSGKTRKEVEQALTNFRLGLRVSDQPVQKSPIQRAMEENRLPLHVPEQQKRLGKDMFGGKVNIDSEGIKVFRKGTAREEMRETLDDIKETGQGIRQEFINWRERLATKYESDDYTTADKVLASVSETYRAGSRMFGEVVFGVGKVALSQEQEDWVKEKAMNIGESAQDSILVQRAVNYIINTWNELPPEQQKMWDNIGAFAEGTADLITVGIANKLLVRPVKNVFRELTEQGVKPTGRTVPPPPPKPVAETPKVDTPATPMSAVDDVATPMSGVLQTADELRKRPRRVIERIAEWNKAKAERSVRIKQSSPAVGKAIATNVEDRTINLVTRADTPTLADMRRMVDIENARGDVRSSSVAGESFARQYEIFEQNGREVGRRIGEIVDSLPNQKVDLTKDLIFIDDVLRANRIEFINGRLTPDSFVQTSYTPAQAKAIIELYEQTQKGIVDGALDAKTIHARDRMFATMEREVRQVQQLDTIMVNANGENTSIYRLFRNVFNEKLDVLDPELRSLNSQYRAFKQMDGDITDTILKTSKLNTNIDPAASAAINLKRITGEAMSTPGFGKVASELDVIARELGYTGSNPSDLMRFSMELRKYYPENIPAGGFTGSIKAGVDASKAIQGGFFRTAVEIVLKAGAPNVTDQQRAIRAMLDELIGTKGIVDDIGRAVKRNPNVKPIDLSKPSGSTKGSGVNMQSGFADFSAMGRSVRELFERTKNATGVKIGGQTFKQIDAPTKQEMIQVIDYLRLGKKVPNIEKTIDTLAVKYNINQDLPSAKIAQHFQDLVERTKTIDL